MKTKYERMSKEEKKELYNKYKVEKKDLAKKMNNMFILIYVGIFYSIIVFMYDFFYKNSRINYILDIVIFIFCLLAFLKVFNIKKELLNNYAVKLDDKRKKEVLKKYKK